jgi:hypothetical protein
LLLLHTHFPSYFIGEDLVEHESLDGGPEPLLQEADRLSIS